MNLIHLLPKNSSVNKYFVPVFKSNNRFFSRSSIMSSKKSMTIAVCQMTSTADRKKNFEICRDLIRRAVSHNAKMVFLPEAFDHIGENRTQAFELAEPLDGPLMSEYKKLAAEHLLWLSLGGIHEKDLDKDKSRVYNSHVIINPSGEIASVYRKLHMFDIDIPGTVRLKETEFSIPGSEVCQPVNTPVGKIGLGICYDLRFPEFSLALTKAGAEILTYPSAFTQHTGMAHWESLLRCRAIECQAYVVAAAQTGKHNPKRSSYGHAMVVDPWGCVIACCSEGVGITFADINLDNIKKIRSEMPVWEHRRNELYGTIIAPKISTDAETTYMFSTIQLNPDYIFYKTRYSMAFVNRKCVVPGHVLVAPIRCAQRLCDLNPNEVADLFLCVQTVQKKIEEAYNASSSNVAIQDGPEAGQTVLHLHVHILPRKLGDVKRNDEIYDKLESHDKGKDIEWRSPEEMLNEATRLKKYFF